MLCCCSSDSTQIMTGSKSAKALLKVLQSHNASDVVAATSDTGSKNVVELDSSMSPIDAANTLWKNNILGAPVWDSVQKKYVGFFDMRDILSAVVASVRAYQQAGGVATKAADGHSYLVGRYSSIMVKQLENIIDEKAGPKVTISYLAARNPMYSCSPDTNLEVLCRVITDRRCHRMPLCDKKTGRCVNIISQSALVKFLSEKTPPGELDETLKDSKLVYRKEVVSIVDSAPAFEAFQLLDSHRLSGIAVVDEDGKLLGNTSARDIKLAAIDEGKTAMDQDILSYLASVRQANLTKKDRYPSCHVHENVTISNVINTLAKTGYHRVFVVDSERRPIGVISVADIIRFALENGK